MYLLDTTTLQLHEFHAQIPPYAILSHRWEEDELTFQSVDQLFGDKKGARKVREFCRLARHLSFAYVWSDTCCIDKKRSAELSEAINSMYRWYNEAAICIVYLSDVNSGTDLQNSLWFTRGWTLQELLAPGIVHFYTRTWDLIGTREDLVAVLEQKTSIPRQALSNFEASAYCVAQKLSWVATRQITRIEDWAYSLMGLLNINMPMLYGEGHKAFRRLQEEVMKDNVDSSIFLWEGQSCDGLGLLAASPACFQFQFTEHLRWAEPQPWNITGGWAVNNAGLSVKLQISPYRAMTTGGPPIYVAFLQDPAALVRDTTMGIFIQTYDTHKISEASEYVVCQRVTVGGKLYISKEDACMSGCLCRAHFNFESLPMFVKPLLIVRQGLVERAKDEYVPFDWDVDQFRTGTTSVRAYSKPRIDDEIKLDQWPEITKIGTLEVLCSRAHGVVGYLLINFPDHPLASFELLIAFGLSKYNTPWSVTVVLYSNVYHNLREQHLEHAGGVETYFTSVWDNTLELNYEGIQRDELRELGIFTSIENLNVPGNPTEEEPTGLEVRVLSPSDTRSGKYLVKVKLQVFKFVGFLVQPVKDTLDAAESRRPDYSRLDDVIHRLSEFGSRWTAQRKRRLDWIYGSIDAESGNSVHPAQSES